MCGIVGRAGNLAAADERIFKVMLLLDYFRGQDSTGVASVTKKGYVTTLKVADDPIMLFQNKEYDEVVSGAYDAIWIGHNRAATQGAVNRVNAHPFTCDHITGVHNGTLTRAGFAEIAAQVPGNYDTDSETIFANIAEFGVEDTIPRLQGAYALVWFDAKDNTLNMIRNSERPLFTCESIKAGVKYLSWASEYEMISAAREMSGNKVAEQLIVDESNYAYFPLPENLLHTWTLEQILEGDFKAKTKELRGKPRPPVNTSVTMIGGSNNTSHVASYTPQTYTKVVDNYEMVTLTVEEDENALIHGQFTEEQWDGMAGYGCAVCGADVDKDDEGLLICVNEGVVLCPSCSEVTTTTVVNSYNTTLAAAL